MKQKSKKSLPRAQTMQDALFGPVFICPVFQVLMVVVLVIRHCSCLIIVVIIVIVVVLSLWSVVDELAATRHNMTQCGLWVQPTRNIFYIYTYYYYSKLNNCTKYG